MSTNSSSLGNIVVAGLGKSGLATCQYLLAHAELFDELTIVDTREEPQHVAELGTLPEHVHTRFGIDEFDEGLTCDVAIVSPGLVPTTALYQSIVRNSQRVISEIEFAFEQHPANWIAITGTNGKTTTTALTTHILRGAGLNAVSVGNIGTPAIMAVDEATPDTIFVAEVSSFQLHEVDTFKPRVAALLNITPDHINWHGSMEAYAEDKAHVFAQCSTGDVVLINGDDELSAPYIEQAGEKGAEVRAIRLKDGDLAQWTSPERLNIKGPHNISNALFAAYAAKAFGVSDEIIARELESFMPVEHRLQFVTEVAGAAWYNDSKATNPDAVFKALSAFDTQGIVLLVGGRNKGNRFIDLARYAFAKPNFKNAICFGEAGQLIFDDFSNVESEVCESGEKQATRRCETMDEAMKLARSLASQGDCVVLSPACASFDEFDSFEQRGEVFMNTVREMK